ncbi:hypothetical protein [Flavobacterium sp.]|uniref:hypothetical protein n=1 Tax=Flavobacterium sp. TaxID=239 RepID=UPI0039198B34
MSATPQNNTDNQEIDLSQISRRIGGFFENISTQIFKAFLFFKKNVIWVGILFVLGASLGYYLDKKTKIYDHQLIVAPNFGSVDYLYAKIELINSKIEEGDTLFLKEVVGVKEPKKIRSINISPIIDVYKFIDNRPQNFELIKLLAESGDVKKVVNESITSKNYPSHLISFSTVQLTSHEKTVVPILKYLNDSDFYNKMQKEYLQNIRLKVIENDSTLTQINGFLNTFNKSLDGTQKNDKLIYYNENSQLDDIIKTKDLLIAEQGEHRLELINYDRIVKDTSITLNIRNNKATNGKMKLVLPFLFILFYVLVRLFKSYYKHQMAKLNN